MKLAIGVAPVIALCLLGQFGLLAWEDAQLWTLYAALPVTVLFLIAYHPERPERNWFGTSLLLREYSILSVVCTAILVRVYGPFPGLQWLLTFWIGLALVSTVSRLWVLLAAQSRDQRGVGWFLTRHGSRIYHTFVGH